MQIKTKPAELPITPINVNVRASCFSSVSDTHFLAQVWVPANGQVNPFPVPWRRAAHPGDILPLNPVVPEHVKQCLMGDQAFCHDKASRCPLIQPVNNAGSVNTVNHGKVRAVVDQCMHQSARTVSMRRMHDHPGGLVKDEEMIVFEQDIQGDIFRRQAQVSCFRNLEDITLPQPGLGGRFGPARDVTVDAMLAEELVQAAAGEAGKFSQGLVETLTMMLMINDDFDTMLQCLSLWRYGLFGSLPVIRIHLRCLHLSALGTCPPGTILLV